MLRRLGSYFEKNSVSLWNFKGLIQFKVNQGGETYSTKTSKSYLLFSVFYKRKKYPLDKKGKNMIDIGQHNDVSLLSVGLLCA